MSKLVKAIAVLAVGVGLGLTATWFTIVRGAMGGGIADGPWRTSLDTGSSDAEMYGRARVAVHGLLAMGRGETVYYTATTDSEGVPLSAKCTYRVHGSDPLTRWWSITAYAGDDYLIPNAAKRYSVSKNTVVRDPEGTFNVMLSRENGGENWIPVAGAFSLSLRLYNPDASVVADPEHAVLPSIEREVC